MKRQTKKQWCKDWIIFWGCNDPQIIHSFYVYMGGRGKRPKMLDRNVQKEVVEKTLEFKKLCDPHRWTIKDLVV